MLFISALEALRKKRRRDDDTKGKKLFFFVPGLIVFLLEHVKLKKYEEPSKQHKKKKIMEPISDQVDFVRVKPKDQIPILTFWSTLEPYFRPLTEEDRNYLLPREDQDKYYSIPPLGRHYTDVWLEEELPLNINSKPPTNHITMMNQAITDSDLIRQDISCGPITERLLSSLIEQDRQHTSTATITGETGEEEEDEEEEEDDDDDEDEDDEDEDDEEDRMDIHEFEERLKRELEYVGLFNDDVSYIIVFYL